MFTAHLLAAKKLLAVKKPLMTQPLMVYYNRQNLTNFLSS